MRKVIAVIAMLALGACASLSPDPKRVMTAVLHGDANLLVVLTEDPCSIKEIREQFQGDIQPIAMEGRALDLDKGTVSKLCYVDGADPVITNKVGMDSVDLYYLVDDLGRQGPLQKKRFKLGMPDKKDVDESKIEKLDI